MGAALTVKKSFTIPGDLVAEAETRAGARGLSAYVTKALATQLQIDRLTEYVETTEALHGPIPDDVTAQMWADVEAAHLASEESA